MMFAAVLVTAGCDDEAPVAKSGGSRVDAVAAKAPKVDLEGFCDVHAQPSTAKTMVMPELEGAAPPPAAGWRWINVWATWCKPCVEELPMLVGLKAKFTADHLPLELQFLSVDASAEDVDGFRKAHPETPASLRIKDAGTLPQWLGALGLDSSSALPIHLFVDGEQKIRCVRMGAVEASHYDTVRGMVRAG